MNRLFTLLLVPATFLCFAATASAETAKGEGVYLNFCASCHAGGIAGAPKVGDQAAWKVRSAAGTAAMVANAIKGYQGESGFMPAKGGNSALTDDEVSAAVMYMLEQSK